MNKNLDLRVRRTYACLLNAMLELLKEKSLEDMTINELCERAIVGRGTFYKHFSDKYEFFSFALGEMFEHHLEEAEEGVDDHDPRSYYIAFFRAYIRFALAKVGSPFSGKHRGRPFPLYFSDSGRSLSHRGDGAECAISD